MRPECSPPLPEVFDPTTFIVAKSETSRSQDFFVLPTSHGRPPLLVIAMHADTNLFVIRFAFEWELDGCNGDQVWYRRKVGRLSMTGKDKVIYKSWALKAHCILFMGVQTGV
jgi:hypothetical protein